MAEMQKLEKASKFGDIREISAQDYVDEVNKAGKGVWVILHLYKSGYPFVIPSLTCKGAIKLLLFLSCIGSIAVRNEHVLLLLSSPGGTKKEKTSFKSMYCKLVAASLFNLKSLISELIDCYYVNQNMKPENDQSEST